MKSIVAKLCSLILCLAFVATLCGCGTVYHCDDRKKNYDIGYTPTDKNPLALTEDQELEIRNAAAALWNAAATKEYEEALLKYNSLLESEATKVSTMNSTAASDKAASESKAREESKKNSSISSSKINSSSKTSSSKTLPSGYFESDYYGDVSIYKSPEFIKPEPPDLKDESDISIYNYGGTYGEYIAIRYKIKGKANVSAHQAEDLTENIIGNYNFSYYPDSPKIEMYKDGKFYPIADIYESGAISEQNLKDIWYYFYVER